MWKKLSLLTLKEMLLSKYTFSIGEGYRSDFAKHSLQKILSASCLKRLESRKV
jgi:hypothetical protein